MSVELIDSANISIKELIGHEELEDYRKQAMSKIGQKVKIPGFRKGHIPPKVLEERYKDGIEDEVNEKIIRNVIKNALKTLDIQEKSLIGTPLILNFNKDDRGLDLDLVLGVNPEIDKLDEIKSLIPDFSLEEVSSEEVEKNLQSLAKSRAKLVAKDGISELGDVVNIDFIGSINNEAFEGGSANSYDLELGSNSFVEGFEEALIGSSKGDEKTIQINFKQDYKNTNLAGKESEFKVKVNEVKKYELPTIDNDFSALVLNNEKSSLDDLKASISDQIKDSKRAKLYHQLRQDLINNINSNIHFPLPKNIVEHETDLLFRAALEKLSAEELKIMQEDKEKAKEARQKHINKATENIKITLIVDKLARQNNISINDNELYQTIYYEALLSNTNPRELITHYEQNNMLPSIKMAMLESKVLNFLLDTKLVNKG